MSAHARLADLYARKPVILAPMEDVTDVVFRRLCRRLGATVCVTEFVNVEQLLRGAASARRKVALAPDDQLTGIQIYGADPAKLAAAAQVAEASGPLFIDVNCGCWVPKIVARGAGAGWLRNPAAMVEMAAMVVRMVSLPVTVKTRIGWGPESEMPIVDLARRLEDVGVQALTIHCRTAKQGHLGAADWSWAAKARAVVKIPVMVNGDVCSAADAKRALAETGCAGVMIGRRAIGHPWVFREARALLDLDNENGNGNGNGHEPSPPTAAERLELCRVHLQENVLARGEPYGVEITRRHFPGYLSGLPQGPALRQALNRCASLSGCLDILAQGEQRLAAGAFF